MSLESLDEQIRRQSRLLRGLTAALHAGDVATQDEILIKELAAAKTTLRELRCQRDAKLAEAEQGVAPTKKPMGVPLGAETTGLRVDTKIKLTPVPTGVYHLLDPETDPLLTVTIKNESYESRRVSVAAFIEGISARAIKTVELDRMEKAGREIKLLPSLIPEQARRITEVQRCTLNVEVVDLDQKVESQDTYSLVLLSRNSSFNSVVDPETGRPRDLTKYYGAWVTPHVEPVQALIRKAAEKVPGRGIWGYQGVRKPETTATQVKAIFDTLKEAGVVYVNSVIDFGCGPGQITQRTRLPRESLKHRAANCIDGTVLFASLPEAASTRTGVHRARNLSHQQITSSRCHHAVALDGRFLGESGDQARQGASRRNETGPPLSGLARLGKV